MAGESVSNSQIVIILLFQMLSIQEKVHLLAGVLGAMNAFLIVILLILAYDVAR